MHYGLSDYVEPDTLKSMPKGIRDVSEFDTANGFYLAVQ